MGYGHIGWCINEGGNGLNERGPWATRVSMKNSSRSHHTDFILEVYKELR